jgi:hypothetical protein
MTEELRNREILEQFQRVKPNVSIGRISYHMTAAHGPYWGWSIAPMSRAQIAVHPGSTLTLTNACLVDPTVRPGQASARLFYHPQDKGADPILLATFVPGEILHSVLSFEVAGGILENRGSRPIHVAGFLAGPSDETEYAYEEEYEEEVGGAAGYQ